MKTLSALGLGLLLLPGAAYAAAPTTTLSAPVVDAAGYDAAVKPGFVIPLSGKAPIVFPDRPLPDDVAKLELSTPEGPVLLKGGAPNGRILHTEVEEAALTITGGAPITFTGFSHVGTDNEKELAWGGAFYAANELVLKSDNPLVFYGNSAIGGGASGGKTSHSSGQGGAFCVDGKLEAGGKGPFLFFGNRAEAGKAGTAGSVENSGQGGAIYVEKGMYLTSGAWFFTGNLAQAADAQSLKTEAYDSGYGGAVNSTNEFVLDRKGAYTFIGNRAQGGKAGLSGDCDASGQGGAVYGVDNMEIHNGVFLFNSATTPNAKDLSSGVGGGIYHEAYGNDYVVMLKAHKDQPVFFAGNIHNPGGRGATLNSIYFGNTNTGDDEGKEARSQSTLVVDCDENAQVVMLDPLASQAEGTTGKKPDTKYSGVSVAVHKMGAGVWILGGHSIMGGQTEWKIEEGTLRLTRDAFGAPAHIDMAMKESGDFTADKGTVLEVTPWTEPAQITAANITLAAGSAVRLVDAPYAAKLKIGEPVTLLRLSGGSKPTANASIPNVSGTVEMGGKKYNYRDLAWKTDNNTVELTCVFSE